MTVAEAPKGYPTEFHLPTIDVTAGEIFDLFQHYRRNIDVLVAQPGERISLDGLSGLDGSNATGEAFVFYPKETDLGNTAVDPMSLFDVLPPQSMSHLNARRAMFGKAVSSDAPLVTLQNGLTTVNVFAGALSEPARLMAQIGNNAAAKGRFSLTDRVAYQSAVAEIFSPVARFDRDTTNAPRKDKHTLVEVDDCLAAATHLAGSGLVLERMGLMGTYFDRRDIRVVSATAQSIAALAALATVPTVINVGTMTWGLSEGIGPNKDGRNYVVATSDPAYTQLDGALFLLGDMGDAGEMIPGAEWNFFRPEARGFVDPQDHTTHGYAVGIDSPGPARVAYARGGFLMAALDDWSNPGRSRGKVLPTIMAIGKRVNTSRGFGVRFDQFMKPLSQYVQAHP